MLCALYLLGSKGIIFIILIFTLLLTSISSKGGDTNPLTYHVFAIALVYSEHIKSIQVSTW